jgi:hypothetical protein
MNKYFNFSFLLLLCSASLLQLRAQSDPVTRFISFDPLTSEITVVWDSFPNANVAYYQVNYYYNPEAPLTPGWIPLGDIQVTDPRSFTFDPTPLSTPNPLEEPTIISVQAFDINNQLLHLPMPDNFDSTLHLTASYDSCQASLNLTWSPYNFKQWPQPGTSTYDIYLSDDNGLSFYRAASISNSTYSYSLTNLLPNQDYIVYVSAQSANNPGEMANSNTARFNTYMEVIPAYMHTNYATYTNGWTELSFSVDPASETTEYNLLRSKSPTGSYSIIEKVSSYEKEIILTDHVNYTTGPFYYKLEVINNCGVNIRETVNTGSSIVLSKTGPALSPVLSWNEYISWLGGVNRYTLERKFGNTEFIEIAHENDTLYIDSDLQNEVGNEYKANVCYRLIAYEDGGLNESLSNTICYELPANIRFEYDAFQPGGASGNDTFGPTIDFIPDEYSFKILDRNSAKVYESNDPFNTEWNGYINGKLAPQGVYMAIILYRIGSGKKHTVQGAVVVVH